MLTSIDPCPVCGNNLNYYYPGEDGNGPPECFCQTCHWAEGRDIELAKKRWEREKPDPEEIETKCIVKLWGSGNPGLLKIRVYDGGDDWKTFYFFTFLRFGLGLSLPKFFYRIKNA